MLKEAIELAKLGIAVFPLAANSKLPRPKTKGVHDASCNLDDVKKLFSAPGKINTMAIACGLKSRLIDSSGYIVAVDLDRNHGATEEDLAKFPRTVTVKTRNGYHLYFKVPLDRPCKSGALWGGKSDGDNTAPAYLRSDGLYFVAPPSRVTWNDRTKQHEPEHEYRWHEDQGGRLDFWECQLAELPEEYYRGNSAESRNLAGQTAKSESNPSSSGETSQTSQYEPGIRHSILVSTAVSMRKRGKDIDVIFAELIKRNATDFTIPKENIESEARKICQWVEAKVTPLIVHEVNKKRGPLEEYLLPLGHLDTDYFYTTSSNRQIIRMAASAHTATGLLNLMPLSFWSDDAFCKRDKDGNNSGPDWLKIASGLQEACREVGIYSDRNVRGVGCWNDSDRLVCHSGDKLSVNGVTYELNDLENSKYLYCLRPSQASVVGVTPLTVEECGVLLEACQAVRWKHEQSSILFAGAMAVARLCGALAWRPHVWITGPTGCGKSSVLDFLVSPLLGDSRVVAQGETTAAGIRQSMESDSRPVMFDEAESNNEKSAKRMQHIMELARQASFENDGKILKGTADGTGHSYKITSMFIMASIRTNLIEEADINRFTVLDLDKADASKWHDVKRKLARITIEYGDRLFSRVITLWPSLQKNTELLSDAIAAIHDRRSGQQYGALLAGYYALISDGVINAAEADKLARSLRLDGVTADTQEADEVACANQLLTQKAVYQFGDSRVEESLFQLINKARVDAELVSKLWLFGMTLADKGRTLCIAIKHPEVFRMYSASKWAHGYEQTLRRIPGATKKRMYFGTQKLWCVNLYADQVLGPNSPE